MKIGSLFSGVGMFELGLIWAGLGHVVWQCEIDPWCRAVLERHWSGVPKFDDIKRVNKEALGELAAVDLICGGFPC